MGTLVLLSYYGTIRLGTKEALSFRQSPVMGYVSHKSVLCLSGHFASVTHTDGTSSLAFCEFTNGPRQTRPRNLRLTKSARQLRDGRVRSKHLRWHIYPFNLEAAFRS